MMACLDLQLSIMEDVCRKQTQHAMHTFSQLRNPMYLSFVFTSAVTIHRWTEDLQGMDGSQTSQLGSH